MAQSSVRIQPSPAEAFLFKLSTRFIAALNFRSPLGGHLQASTPESRKNLPHLPYSPRFRRETFLCGLLTLSSGRSQPDNPNRSAVLPKARFVQQNRCI